MLDTKNVLPSITSILIILMSSISSLLFYFFFDVENMLVNIFTSIEEMLGIKISSIEEILVTIFLLTRSFSTLTVFEQLQLQP